MVSQLDFLRKYSSVDCDTLNLHVAKKLGPFDDCTSNQAIAYFELIKEENKGVIRQAAQLAFSHDTDDTKRIAYGIKAMMVLLSLRMLPYLTGRVHTQSTMYAAYDKDATVRDALEIIDIYKQLSSSTSIDRICIKIPATYEGLEACRILEAQGVRTLATTLFTVEQAILASEVGCHYAAPYINELGVHFTPGVVDRCKGFPVVKGIFEYYEKYDIKTRVLPASLVSTDEAMRLSGAHHITISPAILAHLAQNTMQMEAFPNLNAEEARLSSAPKRTFLGKEQLFKETLLANTEANRKLEEAIGWFLKFEKDMEAIMREALQALTPSS